MLKFRFETSLLSNANFAQAIRTGLNMARDTGARIFLRELQLILSQHVWSGAAQATLVPLSTIFGYFEGVKPGLPDENWRESIWAKINKNNPNWWAQHGAHSGEQLGLGISYDAKKTGTEFEAGFEYGHGVLHIREDHPLNKWEISRTVQNKMMKNPEVLEKLSSAFNFGFQEILYSKNLFQRRVISN